MRIAHDVTLLFCAGGFMSSSNYVHPTVTYVSVRAVLVQPSVECSY